MDVRTALFAVAALCSSGCGTLFNADFESDPVRRLPLERPPGLPEGDRVVIPVREPETEEEGAVATVTRDTIGGPLEGAKAIYKNRPLDPEVKWMAFVGVEPSSSRDAYWFTWRGMLLGEEPLELKFQIGGATGPFPFGTIAVLRMNEYFRAGRLQLFTDGRFEQVAGSGRALRSALRHPEVRQENEAVFGDHLSWPHLRLDRASAADQDRAETISPAGIDERRRPRPAHGPALSRAQQVLQRVLHRRRSDDGTVP